MIANPVSSSLLSHCLPLTSLQTGKGVCSCQRLCGTQLWMIGKDFFEVIFRAFAGFGSFSTFNFRWGRALAHSECIVRTDRARGVRQVHVWLWVNALSLSGSVALMRPSANHSYRGLKRHTHTLSPQSAIKQSFVSF